MEKQRIILNMPKDLHKKYKVLAAKNGTNMNLEMVRALWSDFKTSKENDDLEWDEYREIGRVLNKK